MTFKKPSALNIIALSTLGLSVILIAITLYGYIFIDGPDYQAHVNFIRNKSFLNIITDGLPHLFTHYVLLQLSLLFNTSLESTFFVFSLITVLALVYLKSIFINLNFKNLNEQKKLILLALSTISGALFISSISTKSYIGIWSPLAFHNPTSMWLKPFAWASLIFFFLSWEKENKRILLWTSLGLALSSIIKPNFVICFIPAYFAYAILIERNIKRFLYLSLPSMAILIIQYLITYNSKANPSSIALTLAGPWSVYSQNIFFSVLQNLAGVLLLICFNFKALLKDKKYIFLTLLSMVSLLQGLILAESGHRYEGMNFIWAYVVVIEMYFLYSMGFLLSKQNFKLIDWFILSVFILHAVSGLRFIYYCSINLLPFFY